MGPYVCVNLVMSLFFKDNYNVSGKLEEGILIVGKQNDQSVDLTSSEKQALMVIHSKPVYWSIYAC